MAKRQRKHPPKLAVYTDEAMMRRLRREKADTDLSMQDLVNARLLLSYRDHPGPLRESDVLVAAN